jgi:hypothetical protein
VYHAHAAAFSAHPFRFSEVPCHGFQGVYQGSERSPSFVSSLASMGYSITVEHSNTVFAWSSVFKGIFRGGSQGPRGRTTANFFARGVRVFGAKR